MSSASLEEVTYVEPRQRVLRALQHKRPDITPFHFELTPALYEEFRRRTGGESVDEFYDFDIRHVGITGTKLKTDFSAYLPGLPETASVDEWGVGHVPGSLYHFDRMVHPLAGLKDVGDLLDYPFPDVTADYRTGHFRESVRKLHNMGYFVQGRNCSIFETAWYMRGMENLLVDFHDNQELAGKLLDIVTEMNSCLVAGLTEAGCDCIALGDDVGTQRGMLMSPSVWREWLKPRLARVIGSGKRINPGIHVWYHSDGDISAIIEDLIEVGVDILNPVQPECLDPLWVKREFGDRLSLWGTIGTQTTMPFGTAEEVQRVVLGNIRNLGRDGGLVIAPTHVLEPDVPWENVEVFVEAARTPVDSVVSG